MFKRFILAVIALLLSINISFADGEALKRYPLYKSMGPMYCGPLLQVNEMLKTEGFEVFALGFGRTASNRDGVLVYAVLLYKHKGNKNNVVIIIIHNLCSACCIFRDQQLHLNNPGGK